MGFTIDKKQFLKALTSVMPAVSTRTTLPILSGIKLIGADTRYSLQTTDLELVISMQGPAQGSGKIGEAVVPATVLVKAVKSMPESEVAIDFAEPDGRSVVEVSSGSRRIAIEALPVGDWPEVLRDIKAQAVCWFEPAQMAEALEKMVLCASGDEARPVLTGVQFNFGEDRIELAATDSYRLGVLSIEVEKKGEIPDFGPIVPARVLKAVAKELKKHDGRGILYVGASGEEDSRLRFVEFSFGTACWATRAIEGEFPKWRNLIPEDAGGTFEFDSDELASAVNSADALRSQKSTPVRVVLGDSCELRMEESGTATVAEALGRSNYSPNGVGPMEIAFNPGFLNDAVKFVGEERVKMRTTDPYKPALFHGENGARYVLMPVRLSR
jgi:DNA polymerase-3 subunit beta